MTGKSKPKVRGGKWKPIMLVQIYRLVRIGVPDKEIYTSLGISRPRYYGWIREIPELAEAVEIAKKELADGESFPTWIYKRLSPALQALWDKIESWEAGENGIVKIEQMLQDNGRRVRQQLFLHALCISHFSPSLAMSKVNITKKELDNWLSCDLEFSELVEEIKWHKGNFFEERLVHLVEEGNPAAVMFANKTLNSNRGYSAHTTMDVNVSGSVVHGVLELSDLMPYLTDASRLELLEAIRKKETDDAKKVRVLSPEESLSREIASINA